MTFSKAVITFLTGFSWAFFVYKPSPVTASVFALCLLTFFATEAFEAYSKMARVFSAKLRDAAARADDNEERLKQLVEAGMRMQAKINEMDTRLTLESVGKFAGLKR